MFSWVDHLSGTFFSTLIPLACGPRHAGQLSAETLIAAITARTRENTMRLVTSTLLQSDSLIQVGRETAGAGVQAQVLGLTHRSGRAGSALSSHPRQSRCGWRRCRVAGDTMDRTTHPARDRVRGRADSRPEADCGM